MFARIFDQIWSSPVVAGIVAIGVTGATLLLGLFVRHVWGRIADRWGRVAAPPSLTGGFLPRQDPLTAAETAAVDRLIAAVLSKLPRGQKPTRAEAEAIIESVAQEGSAIRAEIADLKRVAFVDGSGPQEELRASLGRIRASAVVAGDACRTIDEEARKVGKLLLGDGDSLLAPACAPSPAPAPTEPAAEIPAGGEPPVV